MPRKPKQLTKQTKAADLINLVQTLDKDSLLKLLDVLATIKDQTKDTTKDSPKKTVGKKRGRPKKVDVKPETDILETQVEVDDDDQNDQDEPQPRRTPRKPRQLNVGKQKGSQARVEPFTAKKRPNLFLKSKFANAHKDDTLIDKKLATGRQPTERGVRNELVEVDCNDCGKSYIVNEELVFIDPEEGPIYHCGCFKRKN